VLETIVIRTATQADAPQILRCLAAAFEPYRTSYTEAAYLDTVLTEEKILQRLACMQVFVAVSANDEVLGTIACSRSGDQGHLRGMAVFPEHLGRGFAEKLLHTAESELARQGCARVTLGTTEPLQRAMHFYEKLGYRRSGKTADFFGMSLHEYAKELGATPDPVPNDPRRAS
jgi:ribosomal protein S18 acetylase RimI-like enzyme